MNSLRKLVAVVAVAVMNLTSNALTVSISDPAALGVMVNMDGASPAIQAGYVNTLIGLPLNGTSVVPHNPTGPKNDFIITRSNNSWNPMPGLVNETDSTQNINTEISKNVPNPNFTSSGSGWDIVLAKYGNHSIVWILDGAAFTIPMNGTFSVPNTSGYDQKTVGLSHWIGFTEHQNNVPEGGATFALLGIGSLALAAMRRRKA